MSLPPQQEFPFASLDFPGRKTLMVPEVSIRLGCVPQHIINAIEEGSLCALDISSKHTRSGKACYRIPIEAYHAYIVGNMTGPAASAFIRKLPRETLIQLIAEMQEVVAAA